MAWIHVWFYFILCGLNGDRNDNVLLDHLIIFYLTWFFFSRRCCAARVGVGWADYVNTINGPIGSGKQDGLHKIITLHKVSIYHRTWRSSGVALMFCIGRSGVQDSGPETDYSNGLFIIFSSVSRVNAEVVPLN